MGGPLAYATVAVLDCDLLIADREFEFIDLLLILSVSCILYQVCNVCVCVWGGVCLLGL